MRACSAKALRSIQKLESQLQRSSSSSAQLVPVNEILFSFYNGELSIGTEGISGGSIAVNTTVAFCRSIYFFALFFAVRFLSFFENPASESAIAMACFRSVTFGPCLEPECNAPFLNLCSSSLTRFCFSFFGALGFNFGIAPS